MRPHKCLCPLGLFARMVTETLVYGRSDNIDIGVLIHRNAHRLCAMKVRVIEEFRRRVKRKFYLGSSRVWIGPEKRLRRAGDKPQKRWFAKLFAGPAGHAADVVPNFLHVSLPAANEAVRGSPRLVPDDVIGLDRHRTSAENNVEETLFKGELRHE